VEPETFDLSLVHRGWHGRRLVALRAPLERGIEIARARLAGCRFAACTVVSEFDVDGVLDRIVRIDGATSPEQADDAAQASHDAAAAALLESHRQWRREPGPVRHHHEFGPDRPPHVAGSRVSGDDSSLEFAYVRAWVFERVGGGDAVDALIDAFPMQDELVLWLTEAGLAAEAR
jgi:hypothetical protein